MPDVVCGQMTVAVQGKCVPSLGGNGAVKWSANMLLSAASAQDGTPLVAYEPQVAVASPSAGTTDVYVIYPTWHGTWGGSGFARSDVGTAISHDGGKSFGATYSLHDTDGVFTSPQWLGDPTVVAGASTVIITFVAYRTTNCAQGQPSCGEIWYDYSTNRGTTWAGPTVLVNGKGYFIDRPFWSRGNDGNLYLSFTWYAPDANGQPAGPSRLVKFDSQGKATIFGHSMKFAQSAVAATSAGQVFVAADVGTASDSFQFATVYSAPNDDSQPFSVVTSRQSEQGRDNDFRNLNQWLTGSRSDQMLMVWRYNFTGSTHIAATATAAGAWPVGPLTGSLVDDAPLAVNCAYPVSVSDENSHWHVMWQDNRYGKWATFHSWSLDGGKTFAPSSRVSDAFFTEYGWIDPKTGVHDRFLGDYNSIAEINATLFAAWVDTRNGISQVYFSTAPAP